jgi:CSLREA domain-containing protein
MIVLKARGLTVGSRVVALGLLMMVATLLVAAGTLVVGASPAEAVSTFTVNKTGDGDDRNLSDARCDTSTNNGSQCTLRAAIEESNDTLGAETIEFDISAAAQTIKPGSPLPTITDIVTIDGYTQQGSQSEHPD